MILPYVYKLSNLKTGEFYFGYRSRNVGLGLSPKNDLGTVYFSSSKRIRENFHLYKCEILAEFYTPNDAYDFEQELIKDNFQNPNCLNKHYQLRNGDRRWKNNGHSETTIKKMTGKTRSDAFKKYRSEVMSGNIPWNKGLTKQTDQRMKNLSVARKLAGNAHQIGIKHPAERTEKIKAKLIGRKMTPDQIEKMSQRKKGKTWNDIYGIDGANARRQQLINRCGKQHPNSKAIITPFGMFDTITQASKVLKLSDNTIRARCRKTSNLWKDWYYKP